MKSSFTNFAFNQIQISTYKFNQPMITTYLKIIDNCPIHRFNGGRTCEEFFTADGSRSHFFTPIQPRTEYYWKLFSESENCIKTGAISKHCTVKSEGCHWTSLTRDHNSWFERIMCCNGMLKCAVNIIYLMFSWQVEFWLANKVLAKLQGSRAVTENQ